MDLATNLSAKLSCSILAVAAFDCVFWYHLNQCGIMLDEYITHGGEDWIVGKGFEYLVPNSQIKGGDARKLCTAFDREEAIDRVESILRKPDILDRETELLRALRIHPSLILDSCYMGVDTDEFPKHWEDYYYPEEYDYHLPSVEEATSILTKVSKSELTFWDKLCGKK